MATKLDKALADKLSKPIWRVWNYIGDESMQLAQECGERMTNAAAMEGCTDANRLTSCAQDPASDKLVTDLIQEHGYAAVQKFLCKHIKLV